MNTEKKPMHGAVAAANAGWVVRSASAADDASWNRLLTTSPFARCVVPMWEEMSGWEAHRIVLARGQEIAGGLILDVRKLPGLPWKVGRVPALMPGTEDVAGSTESLLRGLEEVAEERSIIEIDLKLRIPANDVLPEFAFHREIAHLLQSLGYRPLEKVDQTYVVRIDRDDEALLASFSKSCRNEVRRALKRDVVLETSAGPGMLERFHADYVEMCRRKGAPEMEPRFIVDGMRPLLEAGQAALLSASFQGTVAGMAIADLLGMPCYMLGTRSTANVAGGMPSAGQVVQFEFMRRMRQARKVYYDLGGCEGPEPQEGHPNYGVWKFKHGFQGEFVRFLPYHRKARGSVSGALLKVIHRLRGDYREVTPEAG